MTNLRGWIPLLLLPAAVGCGYSEDQWQAQLAKYDRLQAESQKALEAERAKVAERDQQLHSAAAEAQAEREKSSAFESELRERDKALAAAQAQAAQAASLPAPADVAAPPKDSKKTASGLAYKFQSKGGKGPSPNEKDKVLVHYTGWTTDGKMFDSSRTRGEPISFPVDAVIKGFSEGIRLMKKGDKIRLWIPAKLAYGDSPRGGAPAGMLVFDVELIEIQHP
jgi:peptidylprolyl isomerase